MYMFKCFRFGPKLSAKSCIQAFKLQLFSFSLCVFFRCGHVELCFIFPFYLCECFFFICLITRKDIEYRLVQVVGVTSNRLMCRERERKNKQTVHGKWFVNQSKYEQTDKKCRNSKLQFYSSFFCPRVSRLLLWRRDSDVSVQYHKQWNVFSYLHANSIPCLTIVDNCAPLLNESIFHSFCSANSWTAFFFILIRRKLPITNMINVILYRTQETSIDDDDDDDLQGMMIRLSNVHESSSNRLSD